MLVEVGRMGDDVKDDEEEACKLRESLSLLTIMFSAIFSECSYKSSVGSWFVLLLMSLDPLHWLRHLQVQKISRDSPPRVTRLISNIKQ